MRFYVGEFEKNEYPMDIGEVTVTQLDVWRVVHAFHARWDNKSVKRPVAFGIRSIDWLEVGGKLEEHIAYWRRPVSSDGACEVREAETRMTLGGFIASVEAIAGLDHGGT